jgi:hypothetical protein
VGVGCLAYCRMGSGHPGRCSCENPLPTQHARVFLHQA